MLGSVLEDPLGSELGPSLNGLFAGELEDSLESELKDLLGAELEGKDDSIDDEYGISTITVPVSPGTAGIVTVVVSDPVQNVVIVVVGTGTSTMTVPVSPGTVAGIVTVVVLTPVQV